MSNESNAPAVQQGELKRYGWAKDLIEHLEKTGWPSEKVMVEENRIGQFVMYGYAPGEVHANRDVDARDAARAQAQDGETPETDAAVGDISSGEEELMKKCARVIEVSRSLELRLRAAQGLTPEVRGGKE